MNTDKLAFATPEEAIEVIDRLYPNATTKKLVNHGYDHIVVLVDETYAVRFPRTAGAYARSQYERLVLMDLAGIKDIAIPSVLGASRRPPYLLTSFVNGQHLSPEDILAFDPAEQKQFAENIAEFAFRMHEMLPIEEARQLRHTFQLDERFEPPWPRYFEKVLLHRTLDTPQHDAIAKEYYHKWKNLKLHNPETVLHDDLHLDNMLFQNNRLVGVLDFADTDIGPPEQELRQLYRFGDKILGMAVAQYEILSGRHLDKEAIKIWAIIQDLASYSDRSSNTSHPSYVRAAANLRRWFSGTKW